MSKTFNQQKTLDGIAQVPGMLSLVYTDAAGDQDLDFIPLEEVTSIMSNHREGRQRQLVISLRSRANTVLTVDKVTASTLCIALFLWHTMKAMGESHEVHSKLKKAAKEAIEELKAQEAE